MRLKRTLVRGALRVVGKDYNAATDLPAMLIVRVFLERSVWLARGFLRFRTPIFVARGVRIRGKRFISIKRYSTLCTGVELDGFARDGVQIGERSKIGAHTIISCTSHLSRFGRGFRMGSDSGIGEFGYVGAAGGVSIGDNVVMGQYVSFHSQEHEFADLSELIRAQGTSEQGIQIEGDCWVGARVTFLDGTHVSRGSVVAAGAVVKGSFPPGAVIGGIPARVLKMREP
jgi:acetyltransferase-like isoleucine patch superfamily enzyme